MAKNRRGRAIKQLHREGLERLSTRYETVITEGRRIASEWRRERTRLKDDEKRVFDYYSRPDVQQAMWGYARGRRISVLRCFRPLFSGIEAPEHILYVAVYYTGQRGMWPSLHGQISRVIGEGGERVGICDVVVELDHKRNWTSCFDATRPFIELLRDFGVHACVKFSGNCSAHIIIPGETLPGEGGDNRRARMQMVDCARRVVKYPEKLDRSFNNPSHFLRLAYSMNEHTGLVSVPLPIEEYERFSWRHADPHHVTVLPDWWGVPPLDAQDRICEMFEFFAKSRFAAPRREVRFEPGREAHPGRRARPIPATRQTAEQEPRPEPPLAAIGLTSRPLLSDEEYGAMLTRAHEWQTDLEDLSDTDLREALQAVPTSDALSLVHLGKQADLPIERLWELWRTMQHRDALRYYERPDVQQRIHAETRQRRVRLWGDEAEFQLAEAVDVLPLAWRAHAGLSADEIPAFEMTVARYEPRGRFLLAHDLVIEVDGRGDPEAAREIAHELASVLRARALDGVAYSSGIGPIRLSVQTGEVDAEQTLNHATILEHLRRYTRRSYFTQDHWRPVKRAEFLPVPGSLDPFTGAIYDVLSIADSETPNPKSEIKNRKSKQGDLFAF